MNGKIIEVFGTPGCGKTYLEKKLIAYCRDKGQKVYSPSLHYQNYTRNYNIRRAFFLLKNMMILANVSFLKLLYFVKRLKKTRTKEEFKLIRRQIILHVIFSIDCIKKAKKGYTCILNESLITQYVLRFSSTDPKYENFELYKSLLRKINKDILYRDFFIYIDRDENELIKVRLEREIENISTHGDKYAEKIIRDIKQITAAYDLMNQLFMVNRNNFIVFKNKNNNTKELETLFYDITRFQ